MDEVRFASLSLENLAPELPNKVLMLIVQLAVEASRTNCYNLRLVSRSFNAWISEASQYERIDCLTPRTAKALPPIFLKKPPHYFAREIHVKSISFAEETPLSFARPILVQASHRLISFSARTTDNDVPPARQILRFIKSPYLRRLCLVWLPREAKIAPMCESLSPYHCIPVELFSSVTHFIGYTPPIRSKRPLDRQWAWKSLYEALIFHRDPNSLIPRPSELAKSWNSFQRLTHVAMAVQNVHLVRELLMVAGNLRYVALLYETRRPWEFGDHLPTGWVFARRVREQMGDYRRFALLDYTKLGDWDLVDSREQAKFWRKVEKLIDGGLWSDYGYRWDEPDPPKSRSRRRSQLP